MGHRVHPAILRRYDIRGTIGETLFQADALAIGKAFGTRVRRAGGRVVCVGRDGRLSSPGLAQALIEGLVATGCTVRDMGLGPTPMLYFAAARREADGAVMVREADGAVMVTGSHNPPAQNGFKLVLGGRPFFGADLVDLGRLALAGDFARGDGAVVDDHAVRDQYIDRLAADYDGRRGLSVVWDCGNGAAGEVVQALVKRLPGRHTVLFGEIDGHFPNHHPDPSEARNLRHLADAVLFGRADLGLAFDGDGDRLGVVDGEGRILWGDQVLAILAEDLLKDHPGATILADVNAGRVVFDEVARLGGRPVMAPSGRPLIQARMAESGALLAGGMNGHLFFADRYHGFDDALYAAIRLLGLVARSDRETLAHRRDRLPHPVSTPEMRFDCPDDRKDVVVQAVRARLEAAGTPFTAIDGVRVETADGWWLLRASQTQPALVARCEATSVEGLKRLRATLHGHLAASGFAPH